MKAPRKWAIGRPGFFFPVFFFALIPAMAQFQWQEAGIAATGGCYTSNLRFGFVANNQAGLGTLKKSVLAMHHSQTMMLPAPALLALDFQTPLPNGGLGVSLGSYGIPGFRFSDLWFSSGLRLGKNLYAGVGLYFYCKSIPEKLVHKAGAGMALGCLVKLNKDLNVGAHVRHPISWAPGNPVSPSLPMMISAGFSYRFFSSALWHSELHFISEGGIQLCQGFEIFTSDKLGLFLGMHSGPLSFSGGMKLGFNDFSIILALEHIYLTGLTPSTSMLYAW